VDPQDGLGVTGEAIVINETIHQSTRLRIMSMLVVQPETDRLAYTFIRKTLDLTGGNLTTHLRRLEGAGYLTITKEFHDSNPRTWIRATREGRRAFAEYLSNLEKALGLRRGTGG
jgi:DNA-binding MarR family transcriptional regulator